MRVLFITGEFPPTQGGVGDCTNEIAHTLTERGIDVSVLTTRLDSAPNVERSTFNVQRTIPQWNWSALAPLRKNIASLRPDIVHIQYQTGAFGMQPMINFLPRFIPPPVKKNGVGVVATFHDLRPAYLFPKAGRVRDWVTFQLARGADAVIATNEQDYARVRENLRGLRKWLELIPIGSNITPTTPPPDFNRLQLRDKLGVRDDETLLVYFGFLNESKGAETIIRAMSNLPKTKLLFLGGQTGASDVTNLAYLEKVKQELGDLGLEKRVLWTDYLRAERVSAYFYASDICVLPYRDGASYRRGSFMAALAHGMPIITTYPQAHAAPFRAQDERFEFAAGVKLPALRDGENVLLVPPDNPAALALAVTRIQTSAGLQALLRGNARLTARAFSWDSIADEHLELYERMLANLSP